jgi:DNA helicase-4
MNHDMTSRTPSALIDDLIVHWLCWNEYESFYLCKLAPNLVANPESGDETEKKILRQLRPLLSEDEWNNLPSLIAERRAGNLREIEYERLRREAEEKKRQEIERERICRENQKRELLIKIDKILEQDFESVDKDIVPWQIYSSSLF